MNKVFEIAERMSSADIRKAVEMAEEEKILTPDRMQILRMIASLSKEEIALARKAFSLIG